jgi:hypothetical protein
MTKDELTAWALANGWQLADGMPSLMKPKRPTEAIVRLVFKSTVVNVEVKKPTGKWEKITGAPYAQVTMAEDADIPEGLGFTTITGFTLLMRENKDRLAMAKLSGGPGP